MIEFTTEKEELIKYQKSINEIVVLMESLETLYSKGTSRLLRAKIRRLKQSIVEVQRTCLQKDKDHIESLPPEERLKRGRKVGQKTGYANPKE